MKNLNKIIISLFLMLITVYPSDKRVLVEIFTNSHCPLCPPAHNAISNYLQSSNGDKIEYIYYHMVYPYPTDQLYQDNKEDSGAKDNLYGPYSGTPQAFFDGTHVGNSYTNWASDIDSRLTEQSNFDLVLNGNYTSSDFTVNAEITKTADVSVSDLTINFVVVEDVTYQGNNGISDHKHVMRKIANINGDPVNINLNDTKMMSSTFTLNNLWNTSKLRVVVYLQSTSTRKVYQAASIEYSNLTVTDVKENSDLTNKFQLFQNYPNPFNPTTNIEYSIPENEKYQTSNVKLVIYDVLGNEIKTLVNKIQHAGNYKIDFNASELPSGIYFYKLNYGNFSSTKKMILMK